MRNLKIIGIGAGNPDYVTVQAIDALNAADVFFIPDKGAEKEDLRRLRLDILERFVRDPAYRIVDVAIPRRQQTGDYKQNVADWHASIGTIYEGLFATHIADGQCGALLVWGDPSLYDSTLRIVERVRTKGLSLEIDVIPGISSVQALAARHRVPLNGIGRSVAIMPGRRLAEGFPRGIDDVVVVLDGEAAYRHVEADDPEIFWGAYVGTPDECLVAGRLVDVKDEIERIRAEKRDAKGWIMDSYLLRRTKTTEA